MYDVVIAGAGAVGNYLAFRLAGSGHRVAVVEEHERIGEPVQCTGIVGAECRERFPLFDGFVLRTASSARLLSPSGEELALRRDSPQAYIIDRAAFDRSLAARAEGQGAEYLLGSSVSDIVVRDDGVAVLTEGRQTLRARAAVIATGYSPRLPRKLGLGGVDDLIAGAQAEVTIDVDTGIEVYFDQTLATGFFAWRVPTAEGRALVGLFSRRTPVKRLRQLLGALHEHGKIASRDATPTTAAIPLRPLRKTYMERILVVGDAAGQVKPTTGGGVYYGLLCADIAANALTHAMSEGDLSEGQLAAYERAWHRLLGKELRVDRLARQLYERLGNRQIDHMFHTIASNGIHEFLLQSPELSFDWHGDVILKGLKYLGPWRRLFAFGGMAGRSAKEERAGHVA